MHLILFISLPLALYGKESPGILVEFVAFAIIGALFWGVAIIYVKFFRRNDNSGKKEVEDIKTPEEKQEVKPFDCGLSKEENSSKVGKKDLPLKGLAKFTREYLNAITKR